MHLALHERCVNWRFNKNFWILVKNTDYCSCISTKHIIQHKSLSNSCVTPFQFQLYSAPNLIQPNLKNDNEYSVLICDTQINDIQHNETGTIECLYAESCLYLNAMLSVIMLNVIMLSVVMLNVVMMHVIMLSVIMLRALLSWMSLCWVS